MEIHSVFESTIRYIGSMLSAYELSGEKYPALVKQAQVLADGLSAAWSLVSFRNPLHEYFADHVSGKRNSLRGGQHQHQHADDCDCESTRDTLMNSILNSSQSNIAEAGTVSCLAQTPPSMVYS